MVIIFTTKKEDNNEESNNSIKRNKKIIFKAPEAIWPYSKAYRINWLVFCSWQIALNPDTMELVEGWIEEQTRQVCRNIAWVLAEYNLSLKNVIKTTVYLKNMSDFNKMNNIYKDYFILKPARSTVEVSNLPKNALIEIEVIAKTNS